MQPSTSALIHKMFVCTICGEAMGKHIPKLFLGEEINPVCENCTDSSFEPDNEEAFKTKLDKCDKMNL